jgi:hypothetical protein
MGCFSFGDICAHDHLSMIDDCRHSHRRRRSSPEKRRSRGLRGPDLWSHATPSTALCDGRGKLADGGMRLGTEVALRRQLGHHRRTVHGHLRQSHERDRQRAGARAGCRDDRPPGAHLDRPAGSTSVARQVRQVGCLVIEIQPTGPRPTILSEATRVISCPPDLQCDGLGIRFAPGPSGPMGTLRSQRANLHRGDRPGSLHPEAVTWAGPTTSGLSFLSQPSAAACRRQAMTRTEQFCRPKLIAERSGTPPATS